MIPSKEYRRKTITVHIGGIPLGSSFPIRVQSMANTSTEDTEASAEQGMRIAAAGADYVRFTVPSPGDVRHMESIRNRMREMGSDIPLIADVHFNADIAIRVVPYVDKVRINPGNFAEKPRADKQKNEEFSTGLRRIREKLVPLLTECRTHHVALRIGVNHGSLSARIMDRYGDTPEGMTESALEFLRICREQEFDQVVVSMKSSNVRVMVQATRMVAARMDAEDMHFPLHLGVTEAGEGESGRIKSAAGIGALLSEGLGDTIRVSLTEDPEREIPVALKLIRHIQSMKRKPEPEIANPPADPFVYKRRITRVVGQIGGNHVPVVLGKPGDESDFAMTVSEENNLPLGSGQGRILPWKQWAKHKSEESFPLISLREYLAADDPFPRLNFVQADYAGIKSEIPESFWQDPRVVLVYICSQSNIPHELQWLHHHLNALACQHPVIIALSYREDDMEDLQVKAAADVGLSLIDGFGDGLWISNRGRIGRDSYTSLAFAILQACRARFTRTEYIACPSCGRTNFNLIHTLARIREATGHLKGLKIGVMGCIVNGPGEMADADYGYVGMGKGKITLFKAREVVKRGIPEEEAVEELIRVIRKNGDWVDP